jgi:enoyl-CoA hydratase
VTQFLPRLVGLAKARELIFLGNKIDGKEAARIGLVTKAVGTDELAKSAQDFISELASKAPVSMRSAKKLLNQASYNNLDAQLIHELDAVFVCTTTQDWQEGVDAFAQKRAPKFKGC